MQDDYTYGKLGDVTDDLEPMEYLIEPLIPRGFVTVLASRGGVGKSAYALYLTNILISQNRKVLYLDAESIGTVIKKRLKEWNLHHARSADFLYSLNKDNKKIPYCPKTLQGMHEIITNYPGDLVIIDSLTVIARKLNLNDKRDASNIFMDINYIVENTPKAVMILAHTKKKQSPDEPITLDSIAGSGAITDSVRSVLLIENEYESPIRTVTQVKNTADECAKPYTFSLTKTGILEGDTTTQQTSNHLIKEPEVRSKETKIAKIKRRALELLKQNMDIKEVRKILRTEELAYDAEVKTAIDYASRELNISWKM